MICNVNLQSNIKFDLALKYSSSALGYSEQPEWKRSLHYIATLASPIANIALGLRIASRVSLFKPFITSVKGWDTHPLRVVKLAHLILGITSFSAWIQKGAHCPDIHNVQQFFSFMGSIGFDSILFYVMPYLGILWYVLHFSVNLGCYLKEERKDSIYQLKFDDIQGFAAYSLSLS